MKTNIQTPQGDNIADKPAICMETGIKEDCKFQDGFKIRNQILVAYEERGEIAVVPEGVHTIGEDAFKACVSLKKVVLPQSLRYIMPRAFKGCRNLCELEIPEGVFSIGEYAFHRCHSLQSIHLPDSVKELGNCVFLYCDSLREASIPGVRHLGNQVFLNDTCLERIVISRDLDPDCICDVFTSCGRLFDLSFPDGERYVLSGLVEAAIGELSLPVLIRRIAADVLSMFELDGHCLVRFRTNLKYVEIPEGIEEIGKSCFFDRRGIISVSLPASLKEIKSRAFRNCINLEEVVFQNGKLKIDDDAFKNCTSLKRLIMPGGREFLMQGIAGFLETGADENKGSENGFSLVNAIRQQVLSNFWLCGTVLLKYLGNESRVAIPKGVTVIAEKAFAGKEEIDRILLPEGLVEIGAGAFRGCLLLQTINFPTSLKKIGAGAFENCVKLLRISLPDGLEQISETTFRHCKKLKEVHFGQNLQKLGEQVFYGCNSLVQITLPASLSEIGAMAFYRCSKLESIEIPKNTRRIGNLAFAQSGVREARIKSDGSAFGSDLFADCARLNTLILCEGVCYIPDKMAFGCTALTRLELPETLCFVGRNALEKTPFLRDWKKQADSAEAPCETEKIRISDKIFWDGGTLEGEVTIPARFHIIAGGAFYGNTRLTSISLTENVTWVGKAAFKGCTALSKVFWAKKVHSAQPEVFSGCEALETIQNAPAWNFVGERAFFGCKKLSYLCLSEVEYIGKEAFFGCACLEREKIEKANFIGEAAFAGTPFTFREPEILNEPVLSKGVKSLKVPALEIASILVEKWQQYPYGNVSEGITGIAPYTFYKDSVLETIHFPKSLRFIGEGAFSGCDRLKEIVFPLENCQIGARAFEKCIALEKLSLCAGEVSESAFAWCTALVRANVIGVLKLSKRAFEGCENLEYFSFREEFSYMENAAIEIEDYCFCGCGKLTDIDLSRVKKIGRYAFANCDSLKRIVLSCDTELEPYAFADCGQLEEICILGNETELSLREYAFSGCTALARICWEGNESSQNDLISDYWEFKEYQDIFSVHIPEKVRMIFYSAQSCFEVENEEILCAYHGSGQIVNIPAGIRQIRAEVFKDLPSLAQIHIPETVEYIGARAFHGTKWMQKQQETSKMVIVNHMLLDGSGCVGEVVIPKDVHMICGWAFANGMEIREIRFLSDAVKVEEFAFRNCIYLNKIHLPHQSVISLSGIADRDRELPPLVKQIVNERLNCFKTDENNTLVECTGNIVTLLVADGITRIGENVFQDSNLLTTIILPQSVTSIGKGAFWGCKWLKSVQQPRSSGTGGGIREIGDMAFSGCKWLERVELSEAFTSLGKRAFEHCTSLREIYLPEGMEEIPERAFFRCHSLEQVVFPSTLKRIGKEAFAFCKKLEFPELPEDVMVGERAFVK